MENERSQKLIFVYNAKSGLRNAVLDTAHKIWSPGSYTCSLCDLTYSAFIERKQWKKFRKESGIIMRFLHKDEFKQEYASKFGYKFSLPIVLAYDMDNLEVLITTEELNALHDTMELIQLIQDRTLISSEQLP